MNQTQPQRRAVAPLRTYASGRCIFKEGESGKTRYVVMSGEVELRIKGKSVETVRKGGVLGEIALLKGGARSATAVAQGECVLKPISQRQFSRLVKRSPDFSLQVMQTLADRLKRMNRRYRLPAVVADAEAGKAQARGRSK